MSAAIDEGNQPSSSIPYGQSLYRQFLLAEIESFTQNFDESLIIGRGGFGKVYKGRISDGSSTVVAIKRLDSGSKQGAPEFLAEIEMLTKLRHCHLVSLIGYCNDGNEMILVYEYMVNGTLEDYLHKVGFTVSWVQLLKICIGAGRGLDYLHTHTGTQDGVIHRDVKSSNILLDELWAAKISDFGLCKIGPINQPSTYVNTFVKGTFGYIDPEYFSTGKLTRKSDVYAFGVVLFEVLCGRHAVDTSLEEDQWGLAGWAQDCIKHGKVDQIIDSRLKGKISPKCIKVFTQIANRCLHIRRRERPTMAEVVFSLESAMTLQERANSFVKPVGISALTTKMQKFLLATLGMNSDDAKLPRSNEQEDDRASPNKDNEDQYVLDPVDSKEWTIGRQHERRSMENPWLSNPTNNIHGEQVAAGWPSWLSAVAAEPINGWTPRRPDSYEKIDKIGEGKYSNVYKGRDILTGNLVALKKIKVDTMEPDSVKFMSREIVILRRLDHPNVIKLEALVTSRMSSSLYLVFEYMEHDLAGLLMNPAIRFTLPQVKCYIYQLLSGLEHCHNRHVLHRDIKGADILLGKEGVLKIADFGMGSLFDPNHNHPMTSRVVTLWYRPPELLLGATNYSVGVDLWTVGCILAELLCGKPIMPGRTEVEQLHKIFKLCGSPSEKYWKKSKLPHATVFKPSQPYGRCIQESLGLPPSSLPLVETLLAIDPADRQTATAALRSEFFTTEPYACDPASLPPYPSREDVEAVQDTPRPAAGKVNANGVKQSRSRERPVRAMPGPEANSELQANLDRHRLFNTEPYTSDPAGLPKFSSWEEMNALKGDEAKRPRADEEDNTSDTDSPCQWKSEEKLRAEEADSERKFHQGGKMQEVADSERRFYQGGRK